MRILFLCLVIVFCLSACLPTGVNSHLQNNSEVTAASIPEQERRLSATVLQPTHTPLPSKTPKPTITATVTLTPTPMPIRIAVVGDITICGQDGDEKTASLIDESVDWILLVGDANNEDGTLWQYENCFKPSWGNLLERIYPVPGNHDYYSDPLDGYFKFFGEKAGPPGLGYYALHLNNWLVLGLNTNCGAVPCGPSSEQVQWLSSELDVAAENCILDFGHHPRWGSGLVGETPWIFALWDTLYAGGTDLVFSGHDHHYERLAPLDTQGEVDTENGIRSFIVGTGGASQRGLGEIKTYSEKQIVGQYGVLFLDLYPGAYKWSFVNTDQKVLDSGADICSP